MKKLFLAVLLLASLYTNAQAIHEHTYSPSRENAMAYYLEGVGYRYLSLDNTTNTINIYDVNHNLWKSFDAKIPSGGIIGWAMYASTMLFDLDTGVEVLVYYSKNGYWNAQVVDETGSVLNVFQYAYDVKVVPVDSSWKLIVSDKGGSGSNWTEIYSLPGKFTDIKNPNTNNNDPVSAVFYPNPMDNVATLDYTLPKGSNKGTVQIYSNNGTVIRSYPINQNAGSLLIQRDGLPSGAYYITTTSDGVSGTAKKIVMN